MCIDTLHDKYTVEGCTHPLQIKPANSDTQKSTLGAMSTMNAMGGGSGNSNEERKLFVGMISKSLNDDQVCI